MDTSGTAQCAMVRTGYRLGLDFHHDTTGSMGCPDGREEPDRAERPFSQSPP